MALLRIENPKTYNSLKRLGNISVAESLVKPQRDLPQSVRVLLERKHEKKVAHSVVNTIKRENGDEVIVV